MKHLYQALGKATQLEGCITVYDTDILQVVAPDAIDAEILMLQMLSISYPNRRYELNGFAEIDHVARGIIEAYKCGDLHD